MSLAQFVGEDFTTSFQAPEHLLDFCCSFPTNSFALTTPDLANVGVAISPVVALANHSCYPNAVVVFPNGPLKKDGMHIVAIADINPDEEIVTSYVDVSNPPKIRQLELKERYHFDCTCSLCTKPDRDAAWVDPRESLICKNPKSCDGMARLPTLEQSDAPTTRDVRCAKCSHSWNVSIKDLEEEMRVGTQVLNSLESSDGQSRSHCLQIELRHELKHITDISSHLLTCLKSLSGHLHPASYFRFQLLRGTQLACIDDGRFAEALHIAHTVTTASAQLYPPNHPLLGIQLLTTAKLMQNVDGAVSQAPLAMAALKNAVGVLRTAYGPDGQMEREAKDMLVDLERTMYLFQQNMRR